MTKGGKAEAAQQSPILTSTNFYREHARGHLCRLGGGSVPEATWPRFTSLTV